MSRPIALSIVVPAFNAAHFLPRALAALTAQMAPLDEIVVVDDGSTDDTARVVQEAGVRRIALPRQSGPSQARNAGVAATSHAMLLFVDADVVINPGTLAKIRAHFADHPQDAGLIGSYDAHPDAPRWLSQYRNLLHHFVHQHTGRRPSHFWTGLGALRREAFDAVGGFDPMESVMDVHLGYRLCRAGYALALDPTLQATHLKQWTLGTMLWTDIFLRAAPWTRLLLSDRSIPGDFSLGWRERASVVLAWLLFGSLALSIVEPWLLVAAAALLASFTAVNHRLFGFFARVRGWRFAACSVAMHLLYCASCGIGAALGILHYLARGPRPSMDTPSARGSA